MRRILSTTAGVTGAVAVAAGGLAAPPGAAGQAATPVPIAGVDASGWDERDPGHPPENVIDGDLDTRWSDEGDGAWIELALDGSHDVSAVDIGWYQGDQRTTDFEVWISTDGSSWTTVYDGDSSGSTLQPETYAFTPATASYVRVVGYGNTDNEWTSITELDVLEGDTGGSGCDYPSQILDLTDWKITLPVDDPDESGEQPLEIRQPELDTYALSPWFKVTSTCDGVQFRNPVNGVTTENSSYSRSELREMSDNGTEHASWSSNSGTHTMVIEQAIKNLPNDKPHVVVGQIHDSSDDVTVFRLQGSNLYVTDGNTSTHHLITDDYQLGTKFEAKFVVSDGEIDAYYNGEYQTTIEADFSGGYFKAGAYTQANCGNSSPCSTDNYGQVMIYDLTVTHE